MVKLNQQIFPLHCRVPTTLQKTPESKTAACMGKKVAHNILQDSCGS
jgi:hypothetical protein